MGWNDRNGMGKLNSLVSAVEWSDEDGLVY